MMQARELNRDDRFTSPDDGNEYRVRYYHEYNDQVEVMRTDIHKLELFDGDMEVEPDPDNRSYKE